MHNRDRFNLELLSLDSDLVTMGHQVERAIDQAMTALKERDIDLARQVVAGDELINELRFKIENKCMRLIASQQPVARDLRQIIAAMNIALDLERMADHAKGIAQIVMRTEGEPIWGLPINITRMAVNAQDMLERSLQAYLRRDVEMAEQVCRQDDEVDHLYKQVFNELLLMMIEDPRTITRGTYMLWVGHSLERIGDRVTNIGERIIFASTGQMQELNL